MADLVMPRLSDTMEEGTILRWLKGNGEEVSRGEELVEIETDKATMTYESDLDGVLQIVAAEGETLAVGTVIAHVGGAEMAPQQPADAAQQAGVAAPASQAADGDGHAPGGGAAMAGRSRRRPHRSATRARRRA